MDAVINQLPYSLEIPTDGTRKLNTLPEYYVSMVALSGYWKDAHTFAVRFRWIETVFEKELSFCFEGTHCHITEAACSGRFPTLGDGAEAELGEV